MSGFEVDTDRIRQHAQAVEWMGKDVQRCAEAGAVGLDTQAFGRLVGWIAQPFVGMFEGQQESIAALAGTYQNTADGLRAMANRYDVDDEHVDARMKGTY